MSTISAGVTVPTALNLSGDTTGALTFQVSGTVTAATISAAGNFGIGTASPGTKLDVAGNINVGASGNKNYQIATDSNGLFLLDRTNTRYPFKINAGAYDDALVIGSTGNVGIGTASPSYKLQVNNASASATADAITVQNSGVTTVGHVTGIRFKYVGSEPAAIRAVLANTSTGTGSLGFFTSSDGSGANLAERARITPEGEVYIAGTTDQGAYNLQCNGTGVWGAGAYVNGSDERLKDNIQSLDSGLDVIKAMRPVTFQYKPEYSKDQSVQPGFIAQELQEAMAGKPYLEGVVQEGPNHLNVAYQNIIPILVAAIKEQQEQIKALQDKVTALETK